MNYRLQLSGPNPGGDPDRRSLTELGRALENVTTSGDRDEVASWIDEIERHVSAVDWEVGPAE